MNKILISLLIILTPLQIIKASSNANTIQDIQTKLNILQNQALKQDIPGRDLLDGIKSLQDELSVLQTEASNNINGNETPNISTHPIAPTDLSSLYAVSDKEVTKAHDGPDLPQVSPESNISFTQTNTNSSADIISTSTDATVTPQSMENGKDDFNTNDDTQSTTLHVVDQENSDDANRNPETKSHQSFFLGEGMVSVQALLQTVDAFDAKNKKDKKIGSYKRSLNFIRGYSLGTLTIGKKTIQVLEDNAATKIPIQAVIEKGISKKAAAYIKNPKYNKMVRNSPIIIYLYEYKS